MAVAIVKHVVPLVSASLVRWNMGVVRLADLPAEWSRQPQMLGLPAQ
jgi:hypothetical protein